MTRLARIAAGLSICLLLGTNIKPAEANPALIPLGEALCSNPWTCVVGTIVVGAGVYQLIKGKDGKLYKGKKINNVPSATVHVEGNGSKPYPVGKRITFEIPVSDQQECNEKAQEYSQRYGQWSALPVQRVSNPNQQVDEQTGLIGTPEFNPLYICTIERVS